jgi:hypothetical protein
MNRIASSVVCALALAAAPGFARADSKCNDLDIVVVNDYVGADGYGKEIKVVDLEYYDDEDNKWRGEWTDNRTINYGGADTWHKTLSYVGGEQGVKVKIYYKVFDNGSWGATRTETSAAFQCVDNGAVWVTVD